MGSLHLRLLNSTPQSPGLPLPHCREGCSGPPALLQWLTGLTPTRCAPSTAHPSLWWHTMRGDSGALPPSAPAPRRRHPTLQGLPGPSLAGGGEGGSGFSASRSAPPSPPSRHFAEAGGRGEQLQYRGRGRGPSIRAAAPLIGRRRPPRGRGHMRRRRRRRAPQTLCGRADRRTHARTEARALQRPPARARA